MRIGLAGVGRIGAFHASTLKSLEAVDELVLADVDGEAARRVAQELGLSHTADTDELLDSGIDALVIATATPGHAPLLRQGIERGIPTFCEKPVAATLEETLDLARAGRGLATCPVHVGFQRRFDNGYRNVKAAVHSGELGSSTPSGPTRTTRRRRTRHTSPPRVGSSATATSTTSTSSGVSPAARWPASTPLVPTRARRSSVMPAMWTPAQPILTLDDDTLVLVTSTRYNGAGHDVRMEVQGEKGAVAVGLDDSLAFRSAEEGVEFPAGPPKMSFMERFLAAYRAELTAFCEVAAGRRPPPAPSTTHSQAFRVAEACELSRRERRPVDLSEIKGA